MPKTLDVSFNEEDNESFRITSVEHKASKKEMSMLTFSMNYFKLRDYEHYNPLVISPNDEKGDGTVQSSSIVTSRAHLGNTLDNKSSSWKMIINPKFIDEKGDRYLSFFIKMEPRDDSDLNANLNVIYRLAITTADLNGETNPKDFNTYKVIPLFQRLSGNRVFSFNSNGNQFGWEKFLLFSKLGTSLQNVRFVAIIHVFDDPIDEQKFQYLREQCFPPEAHFFKIPDKCLKSLSNEEQNDGNDNKDDGDVNKDDGDGIKDNGDDNKDDGDDNANDDVSQDNVENEEDENVPQLVDPSSKENPNSTADDSNKETKDDMIMTLYLNPSMKIFMNTNEDYVRIKRRAQYLLNTKDKTRKDKKNQVSIIVVQGKRIPVMRECLKEHCEEFANHMKRRSRNPFTYDIAPGLFEIILEYCYFNKMPNLPKGIDPSSTEEYDLLLRLWDAVRRLKIVKFENLIMGEVFNHVNVDNFIQIHEIMNKRYIDVMGRQFPRKEFIRVLRNFRNISPRVMSDYEDKKLIYAGFLFDE